MGRFGQESVIGITALALVGAIAFSAQSGSIAGQQPPEPSSSPAATASAPVDTLSGGGAAHGKTVYDEHCVECHGSSGKGDGPASHLLTPRPRDFTLARY